MFKSKVVLPLLLLEEVEEPFWLHLAVHAQVDARRSEGSAQSFFAENISFHSFLLSLLNGISQSSIFLAK